MTAAAIQLDELDRRLLDDLQFSFPLEVDPWSALATKHDSLDGPAVLQRVRALKETGVIRQISPIFDTRALGYSSVLVAAKADESRLDQAAAVVSAHAGVSHNYRREAEYNLWFTFAVPPGESLDKQLARLAESAKLDAVRALPNERTFHIGVKLDLTGKHKPRRDEDDSEHAVEPVPLSDFDKQAVRLTQHDLPLTERPFDEVCRQLGVSFEQLKAWFLKMKQTGVMRRFAAILRHRAAGFTANGMVTWSVPDERIEEAGRLAATFQEVSHCYQRPSYPDWPFNLYTMIHARTTEDCDATVSRIAAALAPLGVTSHRTLYSTHEYKKARLVYFE